MILLHYKTNVVFECSTKDIFKVGRSRSPTGTPGRQSNTPETPNQPKPIASPRPPTDGQVIKQPQMTPKTSYDPK